ncbi:hypothetical protein [Terriglobus sp.]|uniref:hypothetical protein n=1 Tax=Terriglobus sp. TaxID=1889013 RepID=UPI003B00DA8E
MISFFIPIVEALLAGYVAAIAVYMGLLFLITRLGRRVLLNDSTASWTYTALHAGTWCLASVTGAYVCCGMSPLPPYGNIGFPLCLAVGLTLVLLRSFRQLPGQMSALALILNLGGILGGTVAALYAHHAFAALRA